MADGLVYRFYVNAQDASDKISAVYGSDYGAPEIFTPEGIFNSELNPIERVRCEPGVLRVLP